MNGTEYRKTAANTISSFDELADRIHSIRANGYAFESECFRDEEACLAVPVYNYCGDIIASISISGRKDYFENADMEKICSSMLEMSSEISRKMGYSE